MRLAFEGQASFYTKKFRYLQTILKEEMCRRTIVSFNPSLNRTIFSLYSKTKKFHRKIINFAGFAKYFPGNIVKLWTQMTIYAQARWRLRQQIKP